MIIFELPPGNGCGAVRALTFGSCRVTNPVTVLRGRGDLKIIAGGLSAHHTAPEALQSLKVIAGDIRIPDALSPYIFDADRSPPTERLCEWIGAGIDVFVLEVSTDQQFCYGEFLLQQNFVARGLVHRHRGALLDWYRVVCTGMPPDEACVQAAIDNIRRCGGEATEFLVDLLRGIRLKTQGADEITGCLREMMAKVGGRWIVIGPFEVPGLDGTIMQDRRTLNATLAAAAQECGALFHDPTQLIIEHGKAAALDGGGADIYEYAPDFYPTVGESLVGLIRRVDPVGRQPARNPPRSGPLRPPASSFYANLRKRLARGFRKRFGR